MKTANHTLPNGVVLTPEMMNRLEQWEVGKGIDTGVGAFIDTLCCVQDYLPFQVDLLREDKPQEARELLDLLSCISNLKKEFRAFLYIKEKANI